eukprot:TRINITY_DN2571_c5_g1_i1.p1 TRINITY_DN2571_c5_g1~~TRINITY_DN2571_c5_g1_i1.p1  ORF type:complete len:435 (-),score=94.20 TRINITY_DN2571_c5_g1_i1:23-1177(-)
MIMQQKEGLRRGMLRHMFVVFDNSASIQLTDLHPSRLKVAVAMLETFINEFFDQNPISQLGIITTQKEDAKKLTDLSGLPKVHISALSKLDKSEGQPSLNKALSLALSLLEHVPTYGSREILIILSSLHKHTHIHIHTHTHTLSLSLSLTHTHTHRHVPTYGSREIVIILSSLCSCDVGDINSTILSLKSHGIPCNVVSMSGELYICKKMCDMTGGSHSVSMNETHLKQVLLQHTLPPVVLSHHTPAALIKIGFPEKISDAIPMLCACHSEFQTRGYRCAQCGWRVCDIPTDCNVCALTLVSSPHLARSYRHLFPAPLFLPTDTHMSDRCFGCGVSVVATSHSIATSTQTQFVCQKCTRVFCSSCDSLIHESLHTCPGCEQLAQ